MQKTTELEQKSCFFTLPKELRIHILQFLEKAHLLIYHISCKKAHEETREILINKDQKLLKEQLDRRIPNISNEVLFNNIMAQTKQIKQNALEAIQNGLINFQQFRKLSQNAINYIFLNAKGSKLFMEKHISIHQVLKLNDNLLEKIIENFDLFYIKPETITKVIEKFCSTKISFKNQIELRNIMYDFFSELRLPTVLDSIQNHPYYSTNNPSTIQQLLKDQKLGTFILRPCSIPGYLALSLVTAQNSGKNTISNFKFCLKNLQEKYEKGINLNDYLISYFHTKKIPINIDMNISTPKL